MTSYFDGVLIVVIRDGKVLQESKVLWTVGRGHRNGLAGSSLEPYMRRRSPSTSWLGSILPYTLLRRYVFTNFSIESLRNFHHVHQSHCRKLRLYPIHWERFIHPRKRRRSGLQAGEKWLQQQQVCPRPLSRSFVSCLLIDTLPKQWAVFATLNTAMATGTYHRL